MPNIAPSLISWVKILRVFVPLASVVEESGVKMRKILEILVNLPNIASLISWIKILCVFVLLASVKREWYENEKNTRDPCKFP